MENQKNNELFDLGSTPSAWATSPVDNDFDPFASEDESDTNVIGTAEKTLATQTKAEPPSQTPSIKDPKMETDLSEKPPIFEYAGAMEDIDDTSKTFDELRIEKSGDFPELEDGKRVSWTIEYGKITKTVADPKGISIGKMKAEIETSKSFIDGLKKSKDKSPACKVKPRVTAQSKGLAASYRGVFTSVEDAEVACKVISIVPAKDGKVYEIRNNVMGKFITPVIDCDLLSDVRAGFIPALPRIPMQLMMEIVSFFRYYMCNGNELADMAARPASEACEREVLVNVYWDKQKREYVVDAPEQTVTKASVESCENLDFAHERYIHFMDIHSHNSMKAFFSPVDDRDEKATRLYTVIGNLHEYFPVVKTRISNGGKFCEINPAEVFELVAHPFPDVWKDKVHFSEVHEIDKNDGLEWPAGGDAL